MSSQPFYQQLHPLSRAIFFSADAESVAALAKHMHLDRHRMFSTFLYVKERFFYFTDIVIVGMYQEGWWSLAGNQLEQKKKRTGMIESDA